MGAPSPHPTVTLPTQHMLHLPPPSRRSGSAPVMRDSNNRNQSLFFILTLSAEQNETDMWLIVCCTFSQLLTTKTLAYFPDSLLFSFVDKNLNKLALES